MSVCIDPFPTQPLNNHLDLPDAGAPKMRLESYDPETYQRLPSISDAVAKFDFIDGDSLVSTTILELFLRHQMDRTFGLILPHRHFDLGENERLVGYGGTSVPWRLSKSSGNIRPSNWLLTADGALRPYEFYYSSVRDEATEPDLANTDQRVFFDASKGLHRKYNTEGVWVSVDTQGMTFRGKLKLPKGAPIST